MCIRVDASARLAIEDNAFGRAEGVESCGLGLETTLDEGHAGVGECVDGDRGLCECRKDWGGSEIWRGARIEEKDKNDLRPSVPD